MFSAVRRGGRRLYELARSGVTVDRTARRVLIERFDLTRSPLSSREIQFTVTCSKGTYIRVLAGEVARACGTVGTLAELRRTEFGRFRLDECVSLAEVLSSREPPPIVPLREALRPWHEIHVDASTAFAVAAGQQGVLRTLEPPGQGSDFACLIAPGGELLAVVEVSGCGWALRRVVLPEACDLYRSKPGC
jgi:tRNA U55 pseudouridine synthase TruB